MYGFATLIWLPQENFDYNERSEWWKQYPKKILTLKKMTKL